MLDNFEHVLDAAPLVADVLAAAPALTVLATSREPLRLRAERLFRVDPLPLPADGAAESSIAQPGPAVELFVAVARARDPGFSLSGDNLSAVVSVCRRLDGLPLAIELAAGRVGLLSVSELAARLQTGLDALDPAPRDAPDRQRTLMATLGMELRAAPTPSNGPFRARRVRGRLHPGRRPGRHRRAAGGARGAG